MSKILITGSTGHLGKIVIGQLLKYLEPNQISALARNAEKAADLAEKGIRIYEGDYDNVPALKEAMKGTDKVLLISGIDHHRLQQHKNVINAATETGGKHIVYTGVALKDRYGSVLEEHMGGHFLTEDHIKQSGLAFTIARNSLYAEVVPNFAGPNPIKFGISLPAGGGRIPFAKRQEMGEAIAKILLGGENHYHKTYEFTGSTAYSFQDIAGELTSLAGKPVKYTETDADTFKSNLKNAGIPDRFINILAGFATDIRNHQYEVVSNDLELLLGRKSAPLIETLKEIYKIQ